jgi:hypothetical protein
VELLLLIWARLNSAFSSYRLREKNEAFEAVIGLLGVFVLTRRGGGVMLPLRLKESCPSVVTFAAVDVLNGSKFNGGNRKGFRFFFFVVLIGVVWFWSASDEDVADTNWRGLGSRSFFGGSRNEIIETLPDKLADEVLLILLVSKFIFDARLLKKGGSIGVSFGDSYALGMAGTGGTSSSSLFPAELLRLLGFGVGRREEEVCGCSDARGCNDPAEVWEVL